MAYFICSYALNYRDPQGSLLESGLRAVVLLRGCGSDAK
jgi:hypothetical protein